MELKPINLGIIELHTFPRKYEDTDIEEMVKDLENSGLRKALYKEQSYILDLDKELEGFFVNNYSSTFITGIVVTYDNGYGGFYDIIIDDSAEIKSFLGDERCGYGYSEHYGEQEVNRDSGYLEDWHAEKSTYFLVKDIK
jgi:hypothetical protein